jgi:NAD-dependent dihydropyrimidine dehydrogenase PreA subunit
MSENKSVAHLHDMNHFGLRSYPDRLVPWREAQAPDFAQERHTGRLRSCGYCGSMHPADVAEAIRQGAKGSWADFKYGWPHKAYFDGVPNPHAGLPEIRAYSSHPHPSFPVEHTRVRYDERTGERREEKWYSDQSRPAAATEHGKFYTVHLQDASPEDRELIERHLGLAFEFDENGGVRWRPVSAESAS